MKSHISLQIFALRSNKNTVHHTVPSVNVKIAQGTVFPKNIRFC